MLDSFSAHLEATVVDKFAQLGTELKYISPGRCLTVSKCEIIVAGYTSKLQVLDVGINRPFKHNFYKKHAEFLIHRTATNEKPRRQEIAHWAKHAWDNISTTAITNTWRQVGIHTAS
jgi:hypothetical protein